MREMINILVAGMLFCSAAAFAGETRPLTAFDKVEVSQGIELHIGCGAEAKAVIDGRAADIADIRTTVEGRTLRINRGSVFNHSNNNSVQIELTATTPLTAINANTGVETKVEACAVSPDHIDIALSTGSNMELAGKTGHATIDANTGAHFEPLTGQRFDVRDIKIDANTGADIRVCKIERLDGHSTLGANIVAESVANNAMRTSFGAAFSLESCS